MATTNATTEVYSPTREAYHILDYLCKQSQALNLPPGVPNNQNAVKFHSTTDKIYFPIPFKETETLAALKAIEGLVAGQIADLRFGASKQTRNVSVSLEAATYFGCQAYMAKVGGMGKLDAGVRAKLKDTDLLAAQSNGYRRMSANLYRTKDGQFFHIHGSLEATTTLNMIGLEGKRPDLTDYQEIIKTIESHVEQYSVEELEKMNAERRQAGVTAYKYEDFIKTPHGNLNIQQPPWKVSKLPGDIPPTPFPATKPNGPCRILEGIKVLELCRIIAGPTVTRILAEYGADVLKITSPNLSDVPFFQVDGNMGKHAADLDLKSAEGRSEFEKLLAEADVLVDGYRPGALKKLGYGPDRLAEIAEKRGKGVVYVNENCFGYEGEWAGRPGWQQIADCVTGVAWAQGQFMGLSTPVVPPFPISDYGTGCMGAIAALTGLYYRAKTGGSYHGTASLMHYDLLLFAVGRYPAAVQEQMRAEVVPEFLALRHHDSVDRISATTLRMLRTKYPALFGENGAEMYTEKWVAKKYNGEVIEVVRPVARVDGVDNGFVRASRPNGSDRASWEDFKGDEGDRRVVDA
ncbi:CAIB/BAIF family enzyme [Talaromyces proteolyticus]|uniref:CAIB/BAIF family enzyme n=1 Tax=Talaromyces proteolyticus TaxID=1131652 RepID=A0AAD4PV15_9EURO|nr:CAIB/BAIF family enzyme [Talaromyces proteolyticus]KAH8692879.1 CAIB/BAIF family enzyme [Talaromyces proteolyticus]